MKAGQVWILKEDSFNNCIRIKLVKLRDDGSWDTIMLENTYVENFNPEKQHILAREEAFILENYKLETE